MPFNDFDFSGGFQPIESATFGVASSPSFYGSSPSDVDLAFGKGVGVDLAKYSLDKNKPKDFDLLSAIGMGLGVAGDVIGATKGSPTGYSKELIAKSRQRMSGDLLTDYLNNPKSNTTGLASICAGLFNKKMGDY
jgi:hypothetical protein